MDPDADHSHTVGRRSGADPNEVALPNSTRRAAARGERSRRSGGDGKPPSSGNKSKPSSSSRPQRGQRGSRTREDESVREAESVFEAESILERREKRRGKGRTSGSRRGDPSRSSGEEASDVDRSHRRGDREKKEKPRREKHGRTDDRRKKPQSVQEHEDKNSDEGSESGVDIAEEKPSYAQYLVQDEGNGDIEGDGEEKSDGDEVVEYVEHEPYSEEDPDDEEHAFEEDIEDANYDEHCGDTTYYTRKSSRESKKTVRRDYEDTDDSDLEELRMGDGSVTAREYPQLKHDVRERGNSPELNPDLRREAVEDDELLRMARKAKDYGADTAGGMADEGALMPASAYPRQSSDPPTAAEHGRASTPQNLDPEDDDKTLLSRYDAPPSPVGPERNLERNPNRSMDRVGDGASGGPGGGSYSNYMLDEEGRRQAQTMLQQTDTPGDMDVGMRDLTLRSSARGQDPPERGQGHDPKGQIGPADPPERSSARSSRGGKHSSDKYRSSRGGKREEQSRSSRRKGRDKKEKKPPAPKGILKKRDAPIPITRFGKPVEGEGAMNSSGHSGTADDHDEDGGDSDPEVTERKAAPRLNDHGDGGEAKDDPSAMTGKSGLRSSGMRQGKYAAINAAAAGRDSDKDDGSDDEETYSYQGHSFSESEAELGDERASEGEEEHDDDDDDNTFKSIVSTADSRFDRSHSHFLRTADLGLTQDTIFAEQFLDEPGAKPEPHYHHPSPHPPPGVQFNIDENWVALDDGRGGHSPIAPQAVDALVAMGYRAACDPMMWTPSARTRKYMTEKGLRFDDVPIPGPLEEGEGGAGDSNCLVWSGKFPHKYHGHDQPAIRSQGIVNMSPEDLVDLLMDSERVSEYNKSSIGRADEVVLSDGKDLDSCPFSGQRKKKLTGVVMSGAKIIDGTAVLDSETDDEQSDVEEIFEEVYDDHGGKSVRTISTSGSRRERRQSDFVGVTKLVRTKNKPPLVRKVLEFFTLLHCRALTDEQGGDGYIIVGRGVIPASDAEKGGKKVMHSEILLNVYIVRRLRNSRSRRSKDGKGSRGRNVSTSGRKASKSDLANRCLMICVNHMKSPMVPRMLGKKVGLSAALNFISDIRALTE